MTTTAIGASRVASERRSGSEFVQSNECEGTTAANVNHMSWLHVPHQKGTEQCIANLRAALARERDRARRVVRVFWRVRYPDSKRAGYKSYSRADAWRLARTYCDDGKVYRVVARRVAR